MKKVCLLSQINSHLLIYLLVEDMLIMHVYKILAQMEMPQSFGYIYWVIIVDNLV